jgi:hypothetical protein
LKIILTHDFLFHQTTIFEFSKLFLHVISLLFTIPNLLHAQAPKVPTPVEVMAGHERIFFQMVVKKKFSPDSKFGFLSVSTFSADYSNDSNEMDLVIPVLVNYNFYKNFGLVAGTTINNKVGFSPLAGLQHSFVNREWVAVSIALFFLNASQNIATWYCCYSRI